MTKTTKIISTLAVLAILVGLMSQSASALTLKERDANAKAKYQQAQGQYQKEVNFYKSARQDFLNARTKYQQFRNADNKKVLEDAARNYLEKAVKSLISRLETIKNWVANRGALPEAEKQAIVAEINQDINWLNERLPKIQTASPTAIKEEAKTVREYWKNHRAKVKRITGQIWAARISFVIGKAEGFSVKVDAKIQELKAAGKDTSQLETWLSDFNQKLSLAKEKYEAAKAKFQAISSLAEANHLFREGHQFIKEADQYIRQAHAQLVQIVKEMRKIGATVE
ncbi:MAG: hypothetical protein COU46_00440 [Candidatus Niyogibacteria bacterium CG10_big_fil_rev_8_21_14_0_10_42_19]|uniref:DUF5667 domain-containing protein n=1 Tax=Candidatus Niyogibacteria bacterium CG10_big_fil_rev_8_21_14_0_10_42_19 TaxID=1974725 RepID=A0A2H0TGF5_9BACT|nr:MAG: hypothetical protein COU46_00440 [Candidatus Niyogibacteria bacterium CG10_big_fil_rev_8_21_14_0_10_42_19]